MSNIKAVGFLFEREEGNGLKEDNAFINQIINLQKTTNLYYTFEFDYICPVP
jgi:hypothetical protein